jgi:hypothetical protein
MKKAILVIFCSISIVFHAQLKVGKQPKVIQSNTYLQVESDASEPFVVTKDSAKVGIGTLTPANKVEIKHGVAGNSGLRLTNLPNSSTALSASSVGQKFLSVNNQGDVVLASSVDQIIAVTGLASGLVSPVAASTFQAGTFENNYSKIDSNVLYVNQTDGTSWVYSASNGGQYRSYVAPASTTSFFLANTTTDASSNKTNAIYRTGSIGIGSGASNPLGLLNVIGATSGSSGASGSGALVWFRQNTPWSLNAPYTLWVDGYSYLSGFRINGADGQRAIYNQIANTELGFGSNGGDITFSYNGGLTRGLTFKNSNGFLGILTNSPSYSLDVSGTARIQATPVITTATRALVKDPTTGQICEQTISNIATKQMVRAAYNFNASLTTAGGTFVGFNNVSVNTVPSGFNASLGEFTAQTTGQYLVSANLTTYSASLVPGNFIEVFVLVGGVSQGSFVTQIPQGGNSNITAAGTMVVNATSGQIIKFNYSTSFNSSTHISGTHFSIVQL